MTPDAIVQLIVGIALAAGGWLLRHYSGLPGTPVPAAPGTPAAPAAPAPVNTSSPTMTVLQGLLNSATLQHELQLILSALADQAIAHAPGLPLATATPAPAAEGTAAAHA